MANEREDLVTAYALGLDCVAGQASDPIEIFSSAPITIMQTNETATGTASIYCSPDGVTFKPWVVESQNFDFTLIQGEIKAGRFGWAFIQIVVNPGGTNTSDWVIQQRNA